MKIGDKVRLLRGTEEGRIVNFKSNKIVEIEIEDGFTIPALKNEVVVVDSSEADGFQAEQQTKEPQIKTEGSNISNGLYLGLKEMEPERIDVYFLNRTGDQVLYTISEKDKKVIRGKSLGICEKFDIKWVGSFTSGIFDASKGILVECVIYEEETRSKKPPITAGIHIDKDQLTDRVSVDPVYGELALIHLDEHKPMRIDAVQIRERMTDDTISPSHIKKIQAALTEDEVDLHMDTGPLNPNEILEKQLNEFEKAYDNALVMNLQKLKVIHGVGAGILRNEIHKRLSRKTEVKFFEDADKEKFGFGSTIIYF
ncbi:MAG: Smr/MutS family protein [Cytophagales bacterium]|nr:Smr/MutS family protein [Cytophagales bacterium]